MSNIGTQSSFRILSFFSGDATFNGLYFHNQRAGELKLKLSAVCRYVGINNLKQNPRVTNRRPGYRPHSIYFLVWNISFQIFCVRASGNNDISLWDRVGVMWRSVYVAEIGLGYLIHG